MIAKTNTQYYQDIADSIRYSKDSFQYESDLIQKKNKINQMNEDIAAAYDEAEAKGATMPAIESSANLADTVASIPQGGQPIEEKDVNFYDYDGTVLYAYTAQEALALTELPEAPIHEGLTFQEWNWTLTDLQAYVAEYGVGAVGATYITDDGVTRLYLEVGEDIPLDYELYVQIANGTLSVEVDGQVLGSATGTISSYVAYTIPFTLPSSGAVRADLKFTGTGGFYLGQGSNIFGANNLQNSTLVKVEIGDSVTGSGPYAFQYCAFLNSITIPNNVKTIGAVAFQYCTSLRGVVFPVTVTSISNSLLFACSSLRRIVIPNSVKSIGDNICNRCFSLSHLVIPNSVTTTQRNAFQFCDSLNNIVIPKSVSSGDRNSMFRDCYHLNNIVLSNGVSKIGLQQFQNCLSIKSIAVPDSVLEIGGNAFYECRSLNRIDLSAYTDPSTLPTLLDTSALSHTSTNLKIYVYDQACLDALSTMTNWSTYASRMKIKGVE